MRSRPWVRAQLRTEDSPALIAPAQRATETPISPRCPIQRFATSLRDWPRRAQLSALDKGGGADRRARAVSRSNTWLCSFRNIAAHTALGLLAEIGDFRRFAHHRELISHLGLVPSVPSGDQQNRGHIIKTGNRLAGGLLVEATCHRQNPARLSERITGNRNRMPPRSSPVPGKHRSACAIETTLASTAFARPWSSATAVARELCGLVWVEMTERPLREKVKRLPEGLTRGAAASTTRRILEILCNSDMRHLCKTVPTYAQERRPRLTRSPSGRRETKQSLLQGPRLAISPPIWPAPLHRSHLNSGFQARSVAAFDQSATGWWSCPTCPCAPRRRLARLDCTAAAQSCTQLPDRRVCKKPRYEVVACSGKGTASRAFYGSLTTFSNVEVHRRLLVALRSAETEDDRVRWSFALILRETSRRWLLLVVGVPRAARRLGGERQYALAATYATFGRSTGCFSVWSRRALS